MSEFPTVGPAESEFNAMGLVPANIQIDHEQILSLDDLFRTMSATYDTSRGLQILYAIPNTLTINGKVDEYCRAIYIKDDCAVVEYNREANRRTGWVALILVRQDLSDIVRPIPLLAQGAIAASVDARDIISKFIAADDLLKHLENIVDRA